MGEAVKPARSARTNYHRGDLKPDLIRLARDHISAHGVASLSLAELARHAGVAQSAPYRHFADRGALLQALATEGFREFRDALDAASVNPGADDVLTRMASAYVRFAEGNIELYRLMFGSGVVQTVMDGSDLQIAADESFDCLRNTVRDTVQATDVDLVARIIWAQLHGLVLLKAEGFFHYDLAAITSFLPTLNLANFK